MTQQIVRGNNQILIVSAGEEPDFGFSSIKTINQIVGELFHYTQQCGGVISLNGQRVFALSLGQTDGAPILDGDYVGCSRNKEYVLARPFKSLLR